MGPIGTHVWDLHWDQNGTPQNLKNATLQSWGWDTYGSALSCFLWDPGLEPMGGNCIGTQNGTQGNFVQGNPVIMVMGHIWLGPFLGLYRTLD